MEKSIEEAYSPDQFRELGYKMIDMLAAQLHASQSDDNFKTIDRVPPQEQLDYWQNDFDATGGGDPEDLFEKIIKGTIKLVSPRYMGHQVPPVLPVTVLTSALMAFLNNGMGVYEMGMTGNAMERVIIAHLARRFGLNDDAAGFITSGGSLGNLTALLAARASFTDTDTSDSGDLAVMVSSEAHYSVERACAIMGIPSENVIKVPVKDDFSIDTDALEPCYQSARATGKKTICIIGCCCTTATGAYDDLSAIGDFAKRHSIWFHADGAHGGAAIFSPTYAHLLNGIEKADSIILDFHKMLLAPSLSTAVIFRSRQQSRMAFSQKAAYLWQDQQRDEWYNSAKQTFECTKPMTILHIYAVLKVYGEQLYCEYIDKAYGLAKTFAAMLEKRTDFELACRPQSNIVCFRYKNGRSSENDLNQNILESLVTAGKFYIVGTTINGQFYLRTSLMNPMTEVCHLEELIQAIVAAGKLVTM